MPAVIPFIPLIAAGVSTAGGLYMANKQAKQNQQYIQGQDQQLAQVHQMANDIVSRVSRAEYDQQANYDVNSALQDVFGAMAARGMGRSTAGLTAAAGASAQIRSGYGQQYLRDRLSALQTAGGMVSGVASTPRMGYDSDPYAGFRSGMTGLSNAAAYYTANGWPSRTAAVPSYTANPDPYFRVGYPTTSTAYGGSFGVKYP